MLISALCFFITILLYIISRKIYMRLQRWWCMPVLAVSLSLILFLLLFQISYAEYIRYNRWLIWLLGPVMVSFAIPLYQHRQMIKNHWLSLSLGVVVGIVVSLVVSLALARLFQMPPEMQKSLITRSISMPFAMNVAEQISGNPSQAAVFVIFTGVFGNLIGLLWINVIHIRSFLAKGAMLGAASHGIGAARAFEINASSGVVASLVMMISGMTTMLLAPLIALLFA